MCAIVKILFVHLGRENLGVEYLSAVLKAAGHETALAVDIGLFGPNDNIFYLPALEKVFSQRNAIIKKFRRFAPDLVCMSAYTGTVQWCQELAREFKAVRDVPIVIGGVHVTLEPETAMAAPEVDYGVCGEAESVIADIADRVSRGESPEGLPGVVYRRDGAIITNGAAPLVQDLDTLPLPDKSLFEHVLDIRDDYMALPSRGCPYKCTYCCEHALHRAYPDAPYFRTRSVDGFLEELRIMKSRYDFKEAYFCGPVFPWNKDWVREFSRRYAREIGVPFWCYAHVHHVDEEYARLLKEAGCFMVEIGLQTVNEDIRRRVLGRPESNEDAARAMRALDRAGPAMDIGHIIYLPGETEDDYRRAVEFYSQFRGVHRIKVFNLALFPGTRMLDIVRERGLIDEKAHQAVRHGRTMGYFHSILTSSPVPEWKLRAYGYLLRLLPMLSRQRALAALSEAELKKMARLPKLWVRIMEMMYLLRIGDLRLRLYMRLYARHFLKLITGTRKP